MELLADIEQEHPLAKPKQIPSSQEEELDSESDDSLED
jgi:hypothetical protein